jgi:hypothetical protein
MIGGSKITITESSSKSHFLSLILAIAAILILFYLVGHYYNKKSENNNENFTQDMSHIDDDDGNSDTKSIDNIQNTNELETTNKSNDNEVRENFEANILEPNILKKIINNKKNQFSMDEYPKDKLCASELLPADSNSKWAQVNPTGQGELGDANFLEAGFHIGTNTVGQTLRNPNLQLRSEPANPKVQVSPWMQSTMEADSGRRGLEIGSC